MGPRYLVPKKCQNLYKKNLSKIFKFFDPKFLHDFEGIVKYFSARNFGVQYVHPQGTFVGFPFWPQNGDFGQNPPKFRGVPPGCTPPQNFFGPQSNDPRLYPAQISQRNSQNSQRYTSSKFAHFHPVFLCIYFLKGCFPHW